ncbi:DUF2341 domain-containing protein, partial [Candidatus Dojkabacteria bacterium]|nr:DUF2341 domain-containing protein [Candidatus Dojkabacteria bacterium]
MKKQISKKNSTALKKTKHVLYKYRVQLLVVFCLLFFGILIVNKFSSTENDLVKRNGDVEGTQTGVWTQTDWAGGINEHLITTDTNDFSDELNTDYANTGEFSLLRPSDWASDYLLWSRRKSIEITNTEAEQTDYQVKIPVTYDSDMQADFEDLRFAKTDGTPISYWLQDTTDSTNTTAWVKIDTLTAASSIDIFMYYGNNSALSESNGEDVFILFDDFDDGTIDITKWTETDQAGGNEIYEQNGKLNFVRAANDTWDKAVYGNTTYARANLSFEMDYEWVSNFTGGYDALMFGWHDSGVGKSYQDLPYAYYNPGTGAPSTVTQYVYEDGSQRSVSSSHVWTEGQDYDVRIRMKSTSGAYYDYSTDSGASWTNAYNSSNSSESNLRPGWAFYSGTHA